MIDIEKGLKNPAYVLAPTQIQRVNSKSYAFDQIFLGGRQGSGKTTYAIQSFYQIFNYDWYKALDATRFDPLPWIKEIYLPAVRNREVLECINFDDAGIHLSKYLFMVGKEEQRLVMGVNAMINTIRDNLNLLMLSSPTLDVMKAVREKSWISGVPQFPKQRGTGLPDKVSTIRSIKLYRKELVEWNIEKTYSKPVGKNIYKLILPSEIRKAYDDKRAVAKDKALTEMFFKMEGDTKDLLEKKRADEVGRILRHFRAVELLDQGRQVFEIANVIGYQDDGSVYDIKNHHNQAVANTGKCERCLIVDQRLGSKRV